MLPNFIKTGKTESSSKSFLNDLLGGMASQRDLLVPFLLSFLTPFPEEARGPGISKLPL